MNNTLPDKMLAKYTKVQGYQRSLRIILEHSNESTSRHKVPLWNIAITTRQPLTPQ